MQVVVRQAVLLFGERYSVGLRDIPAGHCCGADWDYALKCGYVVPQESAKPAKKLKLLLKKNKKSPKRKAKNLRADCEHCRFPH